MGSLRVVHAVDSMVGGGAQQVVIDVVGWLSGQGVSVTVVGEGGAREGDVPAGVEFVGVGSGSFVEYVRVLDRVCRRVRPDVLHAHQRREALACLIVGRLRGIPVVEHAHTYLPSQKFRWLSFRSRRVFSVGPAVTGMLETVFRVDPDRIDTIGNLVPRTAFTTTNTSTDTSTTDTSTTDTTGTVETGGEGVVAHVIGAGRLSEQKDPHRFVDTIAAAGITGTWYGDGPMLDNVREHTHTTGARVDFPGRTNHLLEHFDHASALLLTSRWEGTPLVVLEAFARGLLVIAYHAPGVTELLADNRGILIPANATPEHAATILTTALTTNTTTTRNNATTYAHTHANPDTIYTPILHTYQQLTNQQPT